MTDTAPRTPIQRFTLGIGPLLICGFSVPVSNSMIFPALSELQDTHGFNDAGLGFIAAAGFLVSLLVQLFVAPRADKGEPRRFVLAALVLACVGSTLFAFGSTLGMFIIARAVGGASLGMSGPAVRAITANIDKTRAAERLGRLRGVELAGFTGGPLIGAILIEPFGLRGAFLIFSCVAVIALLVVWSRDLPSLPATGDSGKLSFDLLRLLPVRAAVLASSALFLPVGIYDALWDRYITDRGGNNFQVGLTFLLYTIPFIVLGAAGGRLADRRGAVSMTVVGLFLTAPLVLVYGLLPSAELLVGFAIVEGVIGALSIPATQSLMASVAPRGRAAAAQGLAGSGDLVAATLMALVAPMLYGAHGPGVTFGFAATLMVISGTAVALMLRTAARRPGGLAVS
ncbi:MAG: MFS transporter [Actinobacteria bacterium]|nr:MFS transporter [Actinomycetota bacterium]